MVKPRIESTTSARIIHFHGGNPHCSEGTSTPIAAKNTMHTPETQIQAFLLVRCNVIMRRMVSRLLLLCQMHNPEKIFLSPGRHWSLGLKAGETVQGAMDRLVKAGRIWHEPGKMPRYRRYLDEMPGLVLQDIWVDIRPLPAQGGERLNYDTQKPEALLDRIIKASSNESNLVLDCFCG